MRRHIIMLKYVVVSLLASVDKVYATDKSPIGQFLGSPFVILIALLVIDSAAIAYQRLRK